MRNKTICVFLLLGFLSISVSAQPILKEKWEQVGPMQVPQGTADTGHWTANGIGWIESLQVVDKKSKKIYAGSNVGGLFYTRNAGKTWKFRFETEAVCGVWDFVVDKNPRRIWAVSATNTWDAKWGLGLLYSKNAGKTWKSTSLSFTPSQQTPLYCIERSTINTDWFYICSETDIYRSKDKCKTWEIVLDNDNGARVNFRSLALHKDKQSHVIASGSDVYISRDSGNTWETQRSKFSFQAKNNRRDSLPTRFAFAMNPLNNDQIAVVYSYNRVNYLDRSDDFGKTWYNVFKNQEFQRLDINHAELLWSNRDSSQLIVGSVRLHQSTNGGKTFNRISNPAFGLPQFMHDDIRSIQQLPNGDIWVGCDGGVFKSTDNGQTWVDVSGYGLTATQFYDIAVDSGNIVGGCQDLSTFIYHNGEWSHTSSIYGDGGMNIIDSNVIYIMQGGVRIGKGTYDKDDWHMVYTPFMANRFKYPMVQSPRDKSKIWACDHDIWEMDANRRWTNLTKSIPHGPTKIVALNVSDNDSNIIYFAKDQPTFNPSKEGMQGKLYKGVRTATGYEYIDITASLPILAWREITSIVVNPTNPNEVMVSLYGFDNSENRFKVFKSSDGGKTWQNYSEGLPDINGLKIIETDSMRQLFLATDQGVFYRKQNGEAWVKLERKLPNIHVIDLEYDAKTGWLYAASFGNGIWKLDVSKYLD